MEPNEAEGESMFPKSVGERLAEARREAGLELADVATRTRIPLRQLEALETGRYADLPAITYCIGFAKSYARAVGLDDKTIGDTLDAFKATGYDKPFPPKDKWMDASFEQDALKRKGRV